jgi:hypothetical protein
MYKKLFPDSDIIHAIERWFLMAIQ